MKFTELEAKGIEDLVASSPLMSWMYQLWDVQTTSNLIGIYDLIAVVLLVLSLINRVFLWPAVLMAGAVFITTQTFFSNLGCSVFSRNYIIYWWPLF